MKDLSINARRFHSSCNGKEANGMKKMGVGALSVISTVCTIASLVLSLIGGKANDQMVDRLIDEKVQERMKELNAQPEAQNNTGVNSKREES